MSLPTKTRQYSYPELGSYDNLVLSEVPVKPPKSYEVLVKTHAVSLQFRDLLIATKQYPSAVLPNLVPCSDMAGEIIAVGEDVKKWKVGDRVCANFFIDKVNDVQTPETDNSALGGAAQGVLTEYRTFPAHSLVSIPAHLSYEEASTLPCAALTAYNGLFCGYEPVKAGDTVLIQGTGGVSVFALQFAVASGATVIVTSSSDEKLKVCKQLGAAHCINYNTTPDWDREALKITNGVGVDHIIEVGGNSTLGRSIESVRLGGRIDIIGLVAAPNGQGPVDIIVPVLFRSLKLRGLYVGSVPMFHDMNKLITANPKTTHPVIDRVFPFAEAKAAFAHLQSQAHIGKVVIKL
ncbi:alcohol dehydrogenase superfamily protein [Mycena sanguinolenta]|nr:alcohol dehydrogenase superfamily protein [Mycena sanguinolenta]